MRISFKCFFKCFNIMVAFFFLAVVTFIHSILHHSILTENQGRERAELRYAAKDLRPGIEPAASAGGQ